MERDNERIEQLEQALRWIIKSCDVKIHRTTLLDEIQEYARNSLADKGWNEKMAEYGRNSRVTIPKLPGDNSDGPGRENGR